MAKTKVAIIGGTGYGGGELCRQMLQHPDVELVIVSSIDYVGDLLGDVHLNLAGLTDLRFEEIPASEVAAAADVVFLGLPHTVSAHIVGEIRDTPATIIDLSGDFRLLDEGVYNANYKATHPHPDLLGTFVYGFPEFNREAIAASNRIASPGCHATAVELTLFPFAKAGLLNGVVQTMSATGSSGAGAYPKPVTHHAVRTQNLKIYGPLCHQHRFEIMRLLGEAGAGPDFRMDMVAMSAPLARGILATSWIEVPAEYDEGAIKEVIEAAYGDAPMVKTIYNRTPQVVAIAGTNYAEIGVTVGEVHGDTRTVIVVSAIDNLLKGGAGQAVQSMNIRLGLPETAGLMGYMGIWP